MVFTLSRLDHRKNLTGIVREYAGDPELQELANLVRFAGKELNAAELSPDAKRDRAARHATVAQRAPDAVDFCPSRPHQAVDHLRAQRPAPHAGLPASAPGILHRR